MYGLTKICKLAPMGFPSCNKGNAEMWDPLNFSDTVKDDKIVVEKNDKDGLLIYSADRNGARLNNY
ncbi:hypothetical protein [Wolbachia endosymbiont of Mansonella perstans]|uniref:hypothetical protein n=1 Tax=Wolbachia endosymbiont of Mansonella perstans TaxID=229526 RepID=UPI001CE0778D|nr:hypothetical protein [Wolbachia endosymbiont of Mansonella perstans]